MVKALKLTNNFSIPEIASSGKKLKDVTTLAKQIYVF